jgi:multiple antibiotic resistance protein
MTWIETVLKILQDFGLTFVPLFVAMDAIGVLPILLPLTGGMNSQERNRVTRLAMLTALGLGLIFVVVGKGIFTFLGIKLADFLVGGGLILFLLAAKDLITGKLVDEKDVAGADTVGVVPLGTPLIVGPAVLTTLIILAEQFSIFIVLFSFLANLAIAWIIFAQANRVVKFLGQSGVKAISKIIGLFLAAIAIKMIREGLVEILK